MKKLLLVTAFLVTLTITWGNVFIPPGAQISELLWDENGDWQLEISYFTIGEEYFIYDSVVISTQNYHFRLSLPDLGPMEKGVIVLNKAICANSFDIQPNGDSIFLKTYSPEDAYNYTEHALIFGDFTNSKIEKPLAGHSIALVEGIYRWFVIDNSPTMGFINDLNGVTGTITGTIFDQNNNPVIWRGYLGFDLAFYSAGTYNYSTHLIIGDRSLLFIYCNYSVNDDLHGWSIEPINITIEPDQVYENIDIHITDPNFVRIPEKETARAIKIYPNPASTKIKINGNFTKYTRCIITDIKAKEIANQPLLENSGEQTLELPENIIPGIYVLQIAEGNQTIYTEKIIVNPFK